MKTCKTCRFWELERYMLNAPHDCIYPCPDPDDEPDEFERFHSLPPHEKAFADALGYRVRECTLVGSEWNPRRPDRAGAALYAYDMCGIQFMTGEDFGCACHEDGGDPDFYYDFTQEP